MNKSKISSKDLLFYYENEAKTVPIFGSLREISLVENITKALPNSFRMVLDVGCGEGYLLFKIYKKYPQTLTFGLDISEGRINTTKKKVHSAFLLRSNIFKLPFADNIFDVVICSELLEHVYGYKKAIEELIRVSKGRIIITVPNELHLVPIICPKCKTKHYLDGHINFFTEDSLKSIFKKRKDVTLKSINKFHTIYTYNKFTLQLPLFMRLSFDKLLSFLHKKISFLKPNFIIVIVDKKM